MTLQYLNVSLFSHTYSCIGIKISYDLTKANAKYTCFQSNAAQGPIHSSADQPSRRARLLCNYIKHSHLKM